MASGGGGTQSSQAPSGSYTLSVPPKQELSQCFCFLLRSIDSSLGLTMELRSLASLPSFYTFLLYDGSDCLNSLPSLSPRLQAQG